jgi:twitching motility protein PilT
MLTRPTRHEGADWREATMHIHELLVYCVKQGASDLHLAAGEIPALRLHGEIQRLNAPPLPADDCKRLLFSVMNERQKSQFEETYEADFSVGLEGMARFRVNVFYQTRGIAAVFRTIPSKVIPFDDLKIPMQIKKVADFKRGLVLVTGPTGSGKSTTLASLIDHINQTRAEHILTVEDPIEFVHTPAKCIINQRELAAHTKSFSAALRAALREDPDVILVGEMRDLETIQLALTAAETGHLVFGTLHTKGAKDTIDRVIDVFPADQQDQVRTMLSGSLQAVVSQTLLKRRDGKGRVAACEVMFMNYGMRNLIRENKVFQIPSLMQANKGSGNTTLKDSLILLAQRNAITTQAAIEASGDPEMFNDVTLSAAPVRQRTPR